MMVWSPISPDRKLDDEEAILTEEQIIGFLQEAHAGRMVRGHQQAAHHSRSNRTAGKVAHVAPL